ncbi:Phosphoglycerate mutase-like protein [Mycena kentingensis (nom. inval.)]|nr:Phosphoglycerate mutase-like protein [Mycena kentingensis (nom. inval.)]
MLHPRLRACQPVLGLFAQDDPTISPRKLGAVAPRLGLLDRSDDRWPKLLDALTDLNDSATDGSMYKLFFLGRHGQGYHNVGARRYGAALWDAYWTKFNGDGDLVWGPDPDLTALGKQQARDAHAVWKKELAAGAPIPDKAYSSPLSRAIDTHQIIYSDLASEAPTPLVVENLREFYGKDTCDKRSTRSEIVSAFPEVDIEEGFTEEDELWTEEPESKENVRERAADVVERIFCEADDAQVIAITAHRNILHELLHLVGREGYSYGLATGGILPVVVKATPVAR